VELIPSAVKRDRGGCCRIFGRREQCRPRPVVHGGQLYEGEPGAPGGPSNPAGKLNPRLGRPAAFTGWKGELPTNVYRAASNGRLDVVVTEDQVPDPNGLLLSPDYKKLHVISTGTG
jgi:gluconolactonase